MKWYEKKIANKMRVQIVVDEKKVKQYLQDTDWYVVRKTETGKDVPQEVIDTRAMCRELI